MDGARGDHEPRVDGATHNPAQRVPRPLVKPVEKVVEAVLHHVRCRSVVEPDGGEQQLISEPTTWKGTSWLTRDQTRG